MRSKISLFSSLVFCCVALVGVRASQSAGAESFRMCVEPPEHNMVQDYVPCPLLDTKAPKPSLLPLRSNIHLDFAEPQEVLCACEFAKALKKAQEKSVEDPKGKTVEASQNKTKQSQKRDVLDYSKWDKILAPPLESMSEDEIDRTFRHAVAAEAQGELQLAEELYERLIEV
ncbi:hypothetical protein GUITHDRAFT_122561 [Guillardia theta CCMP2712]|uniref:Uncharacterized protein n=1 Tax=Guillardia theta (strain CCMP2712) TaxID=905079 RepID=L1I573_GUITC|nr:hypothetical protein GUITHDRAFT_122561 [Guillardia theta CCMP2712]EKX31237.1 hypothetical protein GUITHDRAFT_122561 [Guillardia theta CCMP2712]|eukprot:XP_005818217.1 hypothetical protein GUITHDRAFT_122561 [Guillardia theta CCMP2712]